MTPGSEAKALPLSHRVYNTTIEQTFYISCEMIKTQTIYPDLPLRPPGQHPIFALLHSSPGLLSFFFFTYPFPADPVIVVTDFYSLQSTSGSLSLLLALCLGGSLNFSEECPFCLQYLSCPLLIMQ